MGTRSFLIGLISLCMTGCAPKQIENGEIFVLMSTHYCVYCEDESVIKTEGLFLYKEVKNDTLTFIYKNLTDTIISLSFVDNVSSVLMGEVKCSLVGKKTFIIDDREFIVSKYYFDNEAYEGEYYFFINPDYGVLVVHGQSSKPSSYITFFIVHDNISNVLIDAIIGDVHLGRSYRYEELLE